MDIKDLKDIKFIVLMDTTVNDKIVMKWGRCKSKDEVDQFMDIYSDKYPNAHYEIYETNGCLKQVDITTQDMEKTYKIEYKGGRKIRTIEENMF